MTRRSLFIALVLTAGSFCFDVPAARAEGDLYSAVAYSSSTGRYGYSYNCASLERASARAIAECNAADASVRIWTKNGHIAIVRGSGSAIGWGYAPDEATARQLALEHCLKRSSYARIVVATTSR